MLLKMLFANWSAVANAADPFTTTDERALDDSLELIWLAEQYKRKLSMCFIIKFMATAVI